MSDFKKLFGKYVYILGAFTFVGLMAYLSTLPGFTITCTDNVCDELFCTAYCNVTNKGSQSVYLYNYDDWTMDFSPEVKNFSLYIKYYGKWRYTNFTMETRLPNIPDDRKYVFVFPRYSTKEFKIVVNAKDTNRIKYTFGDLDPTLIPYKITYEQIEKQVPIYEEKIIEVKEECYLNESMKKEICNPAYNYTTNEVVGYKTEFVDGDRTGIKLDEKTYKNANIDGNTLSIWSVPIGNRNYAEFGKCRDFEREKGVCNEVDLLNG